jgi:ubiquinone/menaquinone biosynthesis C-methylase UbiE
MSVAATRQKETASWYENYYATKGDDRNDPLRNPGVLFQHLATEKSIVETLRTIKIDKHTWNILDVGCGSGFSMQLFLNFGLEPERMQGIDISEERIARGRKRHPALRFSLDDATNMKFGANTFDLAMESTMFVQITDEDMAQGIAEEMIRVVKPGGHILLTDWRYSFGRPGYSAVSPARIARLFSVGKDTEVVCVKHGALLPPLGRFLSKYLSSLYFPVAKLFPLLVGQVTIALRKK